MGAQSRRETSLRGGEQSLPERESSSGLVAARVAKRSRRDDNHWQLAISFDVVLFGCATVEGIAAPGAEKPMKEVRGVHGGLFPSANGGRTVHSLPGAKADRCRSLIVTSSFVGFS